MSVTTITEYKTYLQGVLKGIEVLIDDVATKILDNKVYLSPTNATEFPYAEISLDKVTSEVHSTLKNKILYRFKIDVNYSVTDKNNIDEVDAYIMSLMNKVQDALGNDRRCGGKAMFLDFTGYDMGWIDETHTKRYSSIIVEIMNLEPAS